MSWTCFEKVQYDTWTPKRFRWRKTFYNIHSPLEGGAWQITLGRQESISKISKLQRKSGSGGKSFLEVFLGKRTKQGMHGVRTYDWRVWIVLGVSELYISIVGFCVHNLVTKSLKIWRSRSKPWIFGFVLWQLTAAFHGQRALAPVPREEHLYLTLYVLLVVEQIDNIKCTILSILRHMGN